MRVQVPASVNVKELVKGLNLSPTRSENIKSKIYYFLSRIVSTNDNFKLNEKNKGYRKISSVIMRKVMSRKDYYLIIKLLSNPTDPIIESDNSWQNSQGGDHIGYCKGYRITQKYNTGEVEFKTLPSKSRERILKHVKKVKESNEISDKYQFLLKQYDLHVLNFDPSVFDFIRNLGNELLSRIEDSNVYQTNMVLNLIGRWLYNVERIEKNDLWHSVSPDNYRLHSSLTSLKSNLRPFLLCNGKPLGMIDITASHPYILSSVINNMFLNDIGNGFNLRSIYPEVWNELISEKFIKNMDSTYSGNTSNYDSNDTHSPNNHLTYNSTDTFSSANFPMRNSSASYLVNSNSFLYSGYSSNSSFPITLSFMWGQFFEEKEIESIIRYQQSPFEQDFYKNLIKTIQTTTGNLEDYYEEQRHKLKYDMMLILFDSNWTHRNNIENISMFQKVYPGIDKWINTMHQLIGKTRFSYLLQRTESYLVLDVVCREFHNKRPTQPIFTIHDAVLTFEEYLPDLEQLLLGRFFDITGITVGIKTKSEKPNPEPKLEDVDYEWAKIRPITTRKKFENVYHGVFTSNIERGTEFLKKPASSD